MLDKPQNNSAWIIEHTSDLLRFITLYKYGGVYLDTDMLIVKPLDILGKNWAARQDGLSVNVAALAISNRGFGHGVVAEILNDLEWNFRPQQWDHNGPGAMNRAVLKLCTSNDIIVSNTSDFTCHGFSVYNPSIFYPIHYNTSEYLLEPVGEFLEISSAYGYHLWNKLTKYLMVKTDSPLDRLSRQYCPSVRHIYGDQFGT